MAIKIGKLFSANKLVGTADDDTLIGGLFNDILIGGAGKDRLYGGLGGIDTVDYSTSGAGVTVDLTMNRGTGGDAEGDTYESIENVVGSAFADILIGSSGNNTMTGGAGSDVFVRTAGYDTITDFTAVIPPLLGPDTLIDFNDRSHLVSTIPNGYAGLNWNNIATVADGSAAGSGTPFAYSYSGGPGVITAAGADFTLRSTFMASIFGDILVTAQGWDDGVLKVTQSFPMGVARTLVNFVGFDSIDKLTFSSVDFDDIKLAFEEGTSGDRIDVPVGTDIAALVASAVSDGQGGTFLTLPPTVTIGRGGVVYTSPPDGRLNLLGVDPGSVSADWFI